MLMRPRPILARRVRTSSAGVGHELSFADGRFRVVPKPIDHEMRLRIEPSTEGDRQRPSNWWGLLAPALLVLTGHAQAAADGTTVDKVTTVAATYAKSLGCAVTLDKRNVVAYRIEGRDLFIVLYSIDVGCSGGSAMSRPALAALERNAYGNFYVRPDYSSPLSMSDQFPASTDRIFVKDGRLRFSGRELGPNDALCCASAPVEGWVSFSRGQWIAERRN